MPKRTEERRKYKRFSAVSFAKAQIKLLPCPPLFGDPATGYLVDLSAGGMGLMLPDLIPRKIFLKMTLALPGAAAIKSVVSVRHVVKRGAYFLHGFEFLNPSPEVTDQIEKFTQDYLACEDRIRASAPEVCVEGCSFYAVCTKKQRRDSFREKPAVKLEHADAYDPPLRFKKKYRKAA